MLSESALNCAVDYGLRCLTCPCNVYREHGAGISNIETGCGTDGQTPDQCITLIAMDGASIKIPVKC